MKDRQMHVELVTEYVKAWAWEKRTPVSYDQFYFFGKQTRREYTLAGAVDFVVTDAPSLLTAYYTQVFGDPSTAALFRSMCLEYRRMLEADGHKFVDIWLERIKPYDPRGRFQNEDGAKQIDVDLLTFLQSMKLKLQYVKGNMEAADHVIQTIL